MLSVRGHREKKVDIGSPDPEHRGHTLRFSSSVSVLAYLPMPPVFPRFSKVSRIQILPQIRGFRGL